MLPLFLSVIGCESVFPTVTVPNATLDGVAAICARNPVLLSAIVDGEPGALLVIEILPEALPLAVGANVTVKVVFAPALIEVGCKVVVYPALEIVAAVMFSVALPVLVSVTLLLELLPTFTLPKITEDGVMLSCACAPHWLWSLSVPRCPFLLRSSHLASRLTYPQRSAFRK